MYIISFAISSIFRVLSLTTELIGPIIESWSFPTVLPSLNKMRKLYYISVIKKSSIYSMLYFYIYEKKLSCGNS